MSDDNGGSEGGGSLFEGIEHTFDGALEATGHLIESTGEEAVHAFQAAGSTAEDAARLVASDADVIPGISEVVSVAQTAYHAGAAVGDAITGDWDGAADQSLSMAESAGNAATFGALGLAEGAWDLGNAAGGGDESTDAHHMLASGAQAVGNWLGDTAYNLVHGGDSDTGDLDGSGTSGGDGGADGSSGGGDGGASYGEDGGGYDVDPSMME